MLKALVADTKNNSSSPLRHIIINSDKNLRYRRSKDLFIPYKLIIIVFLLSSDALRYDDLLNYSSESDLSAIDKLQSTISPESCFNIQFTSGTTGRSKAARVSHFSLVNCGYEIGTNVNQNFIFQFYTPFIDPVHFISNFRLFFHNENYLQESVMISTTTMLEFW